MGRSTNLSSAIAFTLANTFVLSALSIMTTNTLETVLKKVIPSGSRLAEWGRMMLVGLVLILLAVIVVMVTDSDWKESILGMDASVAASTTNTTNLPDDDFVQ